MTLLPADSRLPVMAEKTVEPAVPARRFSMARSRLQRRISLRESMRPGTRAGQSNNRVTFAAFRLRTRGLNCVACADL